ncbi:MAG TPA: type VI secretion system protein TssA, partial [Anaeromyxobacter sp.]
RTRPFLDPIAGAPTPAGAALRLDPSYQNVANEVAKLDAPTGGEVDWRSVVRGAGDLLKARTKDVVLASYLAHGLHATGGLDGLSTGLALVADLLDQYWETAFPEVKRIKGRLNAVQWLLERTKAVLPGIQAGAGDAAAVDGLEAAAQRLAEVVRARFADQAPAMGPLLEEVARLKGEVEQARPPPPPTAAPSATPAPAQPAAAPAAPAAAAPSPLPEAPAGALAGAEQATDFLRNVGASLASAAGVLRRAEATDPLAYRVLRTGLWLHMQSAPGGTGGKTAVPPPPEALRAQLAALAQNQRWPALLEEAESALTQHRFWLDLHRHSAQALGAQGGGQARAREAIVVELRALLSRMPQLPSLSFADGSALADAQTRSWLDEEVLARPSGGARDGGAEADVADAEKLAEAKKQLAAGQVAEALGALRAIAAARTDGRGRFAARLELARAAAGAGLLALAKATYDELDREALEHRLDDWEPALAAETLKGLIAATRSLSNDPRGVRDTLVSQNQRLCRLDPAAAHQVWP